MKWQFPLLAALLLIVSCSKEHDRNRQILILEIEYETGYVLHSKTDAEGFTDRDIGAFFADKKLTLYSDLYHFESGTVIIPKCEPLTYRSKQFGTTSSIIHRAANIIEIIIDRECFGKTYGESFEVQVEIFYPTDC